MGVGGFMWAEDLNFLDALYFTVTTITTVGFGDITPGTQAGKVLTLLLAPTGLVVVFGIGISLVEEHLRGIHLGVWRFMDRRLATLTDHFIVCGYGRLGTIVVEQLRRMGKSVVVVDLDEQTVHRLADQGLPAVHGNALEESVLRRAGIERARAVVTTFGDDTLNVYLVLEALDIRKDIEVISAASNRESVRKLYLAGAKRVVSPPLLAGEMLAKSALNPAVIQLVSEVTDAAEVGEKVTQVPVDERSPLVGKQLRQLEGLGLKVKIVLAKEGNELKLSPSGDYTIRARSVLVAAGDGPELARLERLTMPE